MVDDVVMGFKDAVGEPVVSQELPDVFGGIEFRAFGRQRQNGDVGGKVELVRHMPAGLIEQQHGWHMTDKLDPPNITILPLPPKCPELNPAENIWQFLRDNWLSNRIFKSYDDIVDHICHAWNKLVEQPWRIMSIGLRDWAYRF